jgi:predicted ATPase
MLNRLTRVHVIEMVRRVDGSTVLPDEVVEAIVTRTDGVPLFVEEMTKAILESGQLTDGASRFEPGGPVRSFAIPTTLHDSLMARRDRLVTAKALAQYASVIGRHFSYAVLRAVSELDEATLTRELARLVDAELVYQRGRPPHATYMFKHALIRDVAYESLLKRTRQEHHHRIARVLETQFSDVRASQPELLAHHYTEAGLPERAVEYWIQAGQKATGRSANVEAVGQLTRGLEVLGGVSDTTRRARHELALRMVLGPALIATRGYGAPQVHETYLRARELCEQVGDPVQLFQVLRGLWTRHLMRADHRMARELGEQLLGLAETLDTSACLVEAHRVLGTVLWNQGELSRAHEHLLRGIALYDAQQHRSLAFVYGADPGVVCRLYDGAVLWTLGYPQQARDSLQEALILAKELSHTHSAAFAGIFAAMVHRLCGDLRAARQQAEAVTILAAEQQSAQWFAAATILLGRVAAAEGHSAEGIARIRDGLASWRAASAEVLRPVWLALLAEAHLDGGGDEEGLRAIDEALTLVADTGEHWYEPELLRLKGEMLIALFSDRDRDVCACFTRALQLARQRGAKSWELRAAISLNRWWQRRGHREEARDLLAEARRWFTEGSDTADLRLADALLRELSR